MMGLSMGPITGLLVSQIVSGLPASIDLAPLRPDRFFR
jgi:D-amino-acid dehydrogenase